MTTGHESWLDLCAGYALGALEDAEAAAFEEHLASGCPTCHAALADFSEAGLAIALSAPPVPLPEGLKGRVLAALDGEPRAPTRRPVARPPAPGAMRWVAVAMVVMALVGGALGLAGVLYTETRRLEAENAALRASQAGAESARLALDSRVRGLDDELRTMRDAAASMATTYTALEASNAALAQRGDSLALLSASLADERDRLRGARDAALGERDAAVEAEAQLATTLAGVKRTLAAAKNALAAWGVEWIALKPQGDTPAPGRGWICYARASGKAMLLFDALAVPPGKALEGWVIRGGEATSLGLLVPEADGTLVLPPVDYGEPAEIQAFGVSVEEPGGSTSDGPTEVVLLGST